MYKVFARVNQLGQVVELASSFFLNPDVGVLPDGWVEVDEGEGDRYLHAQNNYLGFLRDERGAFRYKLEGGQIIERSEEERAGDNIPVEVFKPQHRTLEKVERFIEVICKMLGVNFDD